MNTSWTVFPSFPLVLVVHFLDDDDDVDDGPAEAHSKIYCRQLEVRHEFYLFACKSDLCVTPKTFEREIYEQQ